MEDAITDIAANENLITKSVMQLSKITYDLQQTSMSLRMVSLKGMVQKIKRTARDTAQLLNKKINVKVTGEECELDKILVDSLNNVITHIIRNAVDHGLETPEERIKAGKNEYGELSIKAYQEQGSFHLHIKDDGKGLNSKKILEKCQNSGLVSKNATLNEKEIFKLIFKSGFSTKETVSDISGRGVGMDAVHNAISDMRGSIDINSEYGHGTEFSIKLPLSMSIFNGIVFTSQNNRYVIASSDIKEIYRYKDNDVRLISNKEKILEKGNKSMPLKNIRDVLKNKVRANNQVSPEDNVVFVIHSDGKDYALEVDSVLENRRIVQKNLGGEFEDRKEFSGGAILSDGHVALILNLNNLLSSF